MLLILARLIFLFLLVTLLYLQIQCSLLFILLCEEYKKTHKLPARQQDREKKLRVRASRASELGKFSQLYVPNLLFLSVFELVLNEFCLHNITCLSVTLLHLYMQCSFHFIYHSWHGTMISQTTGKHLYKRDNLCCMLESSASEEEFLHSKPANNFIILVVRKICCR